uniref:Protein arginine N-methyltransferase domain-containing protein n=1 Tax=Gossypium raimondii TaxID=29730 RepID=A0A0D2SKC4_GOSRA|nr:hypothetical protein B456_007G151000 [Gossypium raimondii]
MGEPDVSFFGCDGEDDKTSDDYYFDSYSHFDVVRTKTYQNVIYRNKFLFQNKVVLDVGAGTGILSLDDYIHAFVAYFDVSFTKCHKLMGFSTGPRSRATHWKQTVLYLEDVLTICEGETIIGSMTVAPNKKNPRDVDIMVKYSLSGRRCVVSRVQFYKMR